MGVSIVQCCARYAEQTAVSAISGVCRIAEETRHMHGVAEAAIAEAASMRGTVRSRVASLATHAEASTAHVVSKLSKRVADAVGHT